MRPRRPEVLPSCIQMHAVQETAHREAGRKIDQVTGRKCRVQAPVQRLDAFLVSVQASASKPVSKPKIILTLSGRHGRHQEKYAGF